MNILILGGTRFLGRYLTENAIKRGHTVTLFNRGKENPDLFPEVETLIGDRNGELEALKGREWDAVIDTCGFVPRAVRESLELLSNSVGHYTFISSGSVYDQLEIPNIDEDHPVKQMPIVEADKLTEGTAGPIYNHHYGVFKALCEKELEKSFPSQNLIIRAGIITGPYDYADRFTYWVSRVARGGEVLSPGRKDKEIQIIDARDLAEWIILKVEENITGTFNTVGPSSILTMEEFLIECKNATNSNATLTWVDEDFLIDHDIKFWSEMPLWIPDKAKMAGFLSMNNKKAIGQGLTFRPLNTTIRDTLAWENTRTDIERKAGLEPEKEKEVLAKWREYVGNIEIKS